MVRVASVFGQILALFPRTEFHGAVKQHQAERYAKGFGCWEQFVAMLFCQLAQSKSLREICERSVIPVPGLARRLGLRGADEFLEDLVAAGGHLRLEPVLPAMRREVFDVRAGF